MARRTHIHLPFRRLGRGLPPIGDEFVSVEALGGIALAAATAAALIWANLPGSSYADLWGTDLSLLPGGLAITNDLRHWVNDGLIAVFFFVVGLEIKRELVRGELRDARRASLPALAAVGGMAVPALIFLAINPSEPAARGWGVPMATDLAFAVGVLALLRARVPPALPLFLLTLAVVDDVISVIVIAAFYSSALAAGWLVGGAVVLGVFFALQGLRVHHPLAYVLPALVLWICLAKAGVPGALTGTALGVLTPGDRFHGRPVIDQLEHLLHPWTTFLVVPVFALANAGIDLGDGRLGDGLTSRVGLGVLTARVVGKIVGILLVTELAVRLGLGRLPRGTNRRHIAGVAALAAMGFTVALVVADLSYEGSGLLADATIGLFAAAVVGAALGALVLFPRARSTVTP